jgi:hypothetical protein
LTDVLLAVVRDVCWPALRGGESAVLRLGVGDGPATGAAPLVAVSMAPRAAVTVRLIDALVALAAADKLPVRDSVVVAALAA